MTDVQDDPPAPIGAMCHVEVWHQWRLHIRDGPVLAIEVLSYPMEKYIRWFRDITLVYIRNPANRDTRMVGYQPSGVDTRMMEVNDMDSGLIQETPSSSSQIARFAKKVQIIIRRCMVSIGMQPSRRRPREPIPDRGARGVKRSARRFPGGEARRGRPPTPPDLGRGHAVPGRGGEMGEGSGGRGLGDLGSSYQVEPFDSPNLGMPSFSLGLTSSTQSNPPTSYTPPPPGLGFSSFQSPRPPGIGSSSF
ncbi:hypothetical protein M9H77_02010 [Catharanthus roseus]|uniref:Uncharacterized protein n=1 Tax=Catharanthus roseus TaxID=4058 RepID=A0ACC0C737_CATRO|nr:hypothetical protein M9H77_02010 [Catharanthus roseus]